MSTPSAHDADISAFRDAIDGADEDRARQLLTLPHVRARVNDPMFAFGQRAAHVAAKHQGLLAALIEAGADLQLKSEWQNGPYTVLDNADEATARFLLSRGATLTANVAARLGWLAELQAMLDAEPRRVHDLGGDGQQPLHEAKTVAVAALLVERGADIDARCIDHRSTPAQYALVDRPEVCRYLLERAATPDIFMAARLGDVTLACQLLNTDPACVRARVHAPGYPPVPPFSIYCWSLGFGVSPHDVARQFGHRQVLDVLTAASPAPVRFINALLAADEEAVRAALADDPMLVASLTRDEHGHLARTIFHEQFDAAALMLAVGLDPSAPGIDGGSALHAACWVGSVPMVEQILALGVVPIDGRDATHASTPLGWTAFGSVHRRATGGSYPTVIDRLVAAGADVRAPGNGDGLTLLQMAEGNADTQSALRRHGAR